MVVRKGSEEIMLDHISVKEHKFGTVGAVARDRHGNLAAATSTGGMTNKKFGRIEIPLCSVQALMQIILLVPSPVPVQENISFASMRPFMSMH